jgi:hypothetical protein
MTQQDERIKYFAEDEVPLPMHMMLVEEMVCPRFNSRFYESKVARTKDYDCYGFYKHISRPILLDPQKEKNEP